MRKVLSALRGRGRTEPEEEPGDEPTGASARDALAEILRTLGRLGFDTPIRTHDALRQRCESWARHVVTGSEVPDAAPAETSGRRAWTTLGEFVREQRRGEQRFVSDLSGSLKSVVSDLVAGLKSTVEDDELAEAELQDRLKAIEAALQSGSLEEIRVLVPEAVAEVRGRLEERRRTLRERMSTLGDRLREMRSHLDATRREADTDPLTRVPNRTAFGRAYQETFDLAMTSGGPLVLAVVDLDHFKEINDTHGHQAGDRVLREVADVLVRTFPRRDDFVARYGGEEFVVLIGDTDGRTAGNLLERLLSNLREVRVQAAGGDITVSASVGYAELVPGDTRESLFQRADRALYAAKDAGRDRSCAA